MFVWPIGFWALSRTTEGWGTKKAEEKSTENVEKKETKETEEIAMPKPDTSRLSEDLAKLKKVSETLDEEKRQGMLSEDAYNELKKQNQEAIQKMEQMNAKASGDFGEKKVYCKKGKHYIDVRDCIESKIPGYVICQEHNEEIRIG
jgi:superfamily I DNA and/or RNA helicase